MSQGDIPPSGYSPLPPVGPPMRVCPKCSAAEKTTGAFCPHCGTAYERKTRRLPSRRVIAVATIGVVVAGVVAALVLSSGGGGRDLSTVAPGDLQASSTPTANADSDGDGIPDTEDPAPNDAAIPGNTDTSTQPTTPNPHSCDAKGIVPGDPTTKTGSCTSGGTRFTVVNHDGTLKMKSLRAQLTGVRETDSLSDPDGFDSASAKGTFVVVGVSLTNRLSSPADIESDQTALVLGNGKQYHENFNAENGPDSQSLLWKSADSSIQPDETVSGDVVFDLPTKALRRFQSDGSALVIAGLGDDVNSTDRYGVIRLQAPGGP